MSFLGGFLGPNTNAVGLGGSLGPGTSLSGLGGQLGSGISSAIPSAIHFWPMNEGSGSTFHDSIGTTNLTASNVVWGVTSGLGASAVALFNGSTTSAVAGSVDSTLNFNGTQPMTIAFWINPNGSASYTFAGNLQTSSSFQGWEATNTGPSGTGLLVVGAVTTNQMTAVDNIPLVGTVPLFLVITYSGNLNVSGVKLYQNGVSETVSDSTGTLTSGSTSTQPFVVGARGNGSNFYSGAMAYMRVWNQVLTQAQVTALFALGPQ